ncbi:hypothetical protein [Clostridium botulinum]|uniref:hypothetical protein n=1 Tax=Clostridium botulinum TaxID=1491 RepID=UPI0004B35B65|nr:hypothetical protein [Clostridium botulinum]QDY27293.1 hypothetical protein CGQ40_21530 [Clostridium botulinum]
MNNSITRFEEEGQGIERFREDDRFASTQLFEDDDEKKIAESILSALEGTSIDSAWEILNKCKTALTQVTLNKII